MSLMGRGSCTSFRRGQLSEQGWHTPIPLPLTSITGKLLAQTEPLLFNLNLALGCSDGCWALQFLFLNFDICIFNLLLSVTNLKRHPGNSAVTEGGYLTFQTVSSRWASE